MFQASVFTCGSSPAALLQTHPHKFPFPLPMVFPPAAVAQQLYGRKDGLRLQQRQSGSPLAQVPLNIWISLQVEREMIDVRIPHRLWMCTVSFWLWLRHSKAPTPSSSGGKQTLSHSKVFGKGRQEQLLVLASPKAIGPSTFLSSWTEEEQGDLRIKIFVSHLFMGIAFHVQHCNLTPTYLEESPIECAGCFPADCVLSQLYVSILHHCVGEHNSLKECCSPEALLGLKPNGILKFTSVSSYCFHAINHSLSISFYILTDALGALRKEPRISQREAERSRDKVFFPWRNPLPSVQGL